MKITRCLCYSLSLIAPFAVQKVQKLNFRGA